MCIIQDYNNFQAQLQGRLKVLFAILIFCLTSLSLFSQQGLFVEYYDGKDFDRFVSSSYVDKIDDTWYNKPPVEGIDPHSCSIRWTGRLVPGKTANYLFSATVDDGIRVWIDDALIIDQWNLNDLGIFSGKLKLTANKSYDLKVEYFNALREGEIKLLWDIEKPKKEQTWSERIFGVDYQHKIIQPEFFFRPDVIEPKEGSEIQNEPEVKVVKEVKANPVKTKKIEKKKITPTPKPLPVKEVMTVEKAKRYIPKNVHFVRSHSEIIESSFEELNIFAQFMIDHPEVKVTIEGHTDAVGDKGKNQFLSERRANKVARYLVKKGIHGKRIKTIGYGGSRPLKIPKKGEYHSPNRRVVFKLKGIK